MASPVKEARAKAQAKWTGAIVVERGRGSIKHKNPLNAQHTLDVQAGGAGWHFGDGPFDESHEVDTAWVDAHPIDDAPWQKKMVLADYNAYAFRESTLAFDQGQLIEYRDPLTGESVTFQPQQLQWTNDLDQLDPIADPQNVVASIVDDTIRWDGAYGSGLDFEWHNDTVRLIKYLHVGALGDLPPPPQFIIDGGNPVLRITLLFQRSSNVEIWVDGILWNERVNNPQTTFDNIEFRDPGTGAVRWMFKAPYAINSNHDPQATDRLIYPTMGVRKSGASLFVDILTPWAWLQTSVYPVKIDATIDAQVAITADDGYQNSDSSCSITETAPNMGTGDSAGSPHCATGQRFDGITLDSADTIDAGCYNEQYKSDQEWNAVDGTWYGEDEDDAGIFVNDEDITARTYTTANVDIGNDNQNRADNTWYKLPSSGGEWQGIIAEIIARGGWSSGNAIVLILDGDGQNYARASFDSYDDSSSTAPRLHIEYTAGAEPSGLPSRRAANRGIFRGAARGAG